MSLRTIKQLWRALFPGDIWKEVHVSPAIRPEPTLRRFTYLRDHGIRCNINNLTMVGKGGGITGMMSLRVHKDDLPEALPLLREVKD